jgi:hypothetical protein
MLGECKQLLWRDITISSQKHVFRETEKLTVEPHTLLVAVIWDTGVYDIRIIISAISNTLMGN